jgi:hypothetical protein
MALTKLIKIASEPTLNSFAASSPESAVNFIDCFGKDSDSSLV